MGTRAFTSVEQGLKDLKMRGAGEKGQRLGTGNKGNQDFDFEEQGNESGKMGIDTPSLAGLNTTLFVAFLEECF